MEPRPQQPRLGSLLQGGQHVDPDFYRHLAVIGQRVLPPFPGPDVLKPALVPPPLLLDPKLPPLERVEALAAAYRGAVEARTPGFRCWTLTRGDLTKHASYSTLVAAAAVLIEREIAPTAWSLFSVDAWKKFIFAANPKAGANPPPRWVYLTSRLEDHAEWFDTQAGEYTGGRTYFAPQHLELAARHQRMTRDVLATRPRTARELLAVVDRHFPDGSWDKLLADAIQATRLMQTQIDDATRRGAVLW